MGVNGNPANISLFADDAKISKHIINKDGNLRLQDALQNV